MNVQARRVETPIIARHSTLWNSELPAKIQDALESEFENTKAHKSLADLYGVVKIDGFLLDPDSTVIDHDIWSTPGTVFVKFEYKGETEHLTQFVDSYPISVKFKFDGQKIKIRDVSADVSSF